MGLVESLGNNSEKHKLFRCWLLLLLEWERIFFILGNLLGEKKIDSAILVKDLTDVSHVILK